MEEYNKKCPNCPKCGLTMLMDYSSKYRRYFFFCPNKSCDVAISAHPDKTPVGIPASRDVRELRQYAHSLAAKLWDYHIPKQRNKMYKWLDKNSVSKHIGFMDSEELGDVIEKLKKIIDKYN
jgi:hypothetical protein